jgi:hypothetical protein
VSEKLREFTVATPAVPEPLGFEARLTAMKLRRRRQLARTLAGDLGWLTLILLILALVLTQFVSLGRG